MGFFLRNKVVPQINVGNYSLKYNKNNWWDVYDNEAKTEMMVLGERINAGNINELIALAIEFRATKINECIERLKVNDEFKSFNFIVEMIWIDGEKIDIGLWCDQGGDMIWNFVFDKSGKCIDEYSGD